MVAGSQNQFLHGGQELSPVSGRKLTLAVQIVVKLFTDYASPAQK